MDGGNANADAAAQPQADWSDPSASNAAGSAAFRADALTAFRRGDYRQAARLANHALVETPQDAKSHELMSLVLFSMGEYRGAAMEAHAATALGPVSDWPTLYAYYNDLPAYTKHLKALEEYVLKNPSAPEGRFVLGYHYMMAGHAKEAQTQFAKVVALAPRDQAAAALLKQLGGNSDSPSKDASIPSDTSRSF